MKGTTSLPFTVRWPVYGPNLNAGEVGKCRRAPGVDEHFRPRPKEFRLLTRVHGFVHLPTFSEKCLEEMAVRTWDGGCTEQRKGWRKRGAQRRRKSKSNWILFRISLIEFISNMRSPPIYMLLMWSLLETRSYFTDLVVCQIKKNLGNLKCLHINCEIQIEAGQI